MTGTVPQYGDLDDHHIVPKSWGKEHALGDVDRHDPEPDAAHRGHEPQRHQRSSAERVPAGADRSERRGHGPRDARVALHLPRGLRHPAPRPLQSGRLRGLPRRAPAHAPGCDRGPPGQGAARPAAAAARARRPGRGGRAGASRADRRGARRRRREAPAARPQKINERLQAAAKKNAALDANTTQTLAGRLEYADLRELQDTVTSKALWPLFQARFANKETLAKRFDQLAELRNGIRHSRTVDEVTRKEGEAALLWFKQVLEA